MPFPDGLPLILHHNSIKPITFTNKIGNFAKIINFYYDENSNTNPE